MIGSCGPAGRAARCSPRDPQGRRWALPRVLGALGWARLLEVARAAALERQEGTYMLVSTRPVSSGSEVSSFFLIGLNGKAHVERLSVFFLSFFSRQTAELFAQMCPCY